MERCVQVTLSMLNGRNEKVLGVMSGYSNRDYGRYIEAQSDSSDGYIRKREKA